MTTAAQLEEPIGDFIARLSRLSMSEALDACTERAKLEGHDFNGAAQRLRRASLVIGEKRMHEAIVHMMTRIFQDGAAATTVGPELLALFGVSLFAEALAPRGKS